MKYGQLKNNEMKLPIIILFVLVLQACADDLQPRTISNKEAPGTKGLTLVGLDTEKPVVLSMSVQAAYNLDTIFFHISWQGDRGDTHDFMRYSNGGWKRDGGNRRDAQSTLDGDPLRGRTDVSFTSAESSVSMMLNDPVATSTNTPVPGFEKFGCFMVCHDDSQYMPGWLPPSSTKMYLPQEHSGRLDLWYLSLARGVPVGWADDQYIVAKFEGGRLGDEGKVGYENNLLESGKPKYTIDGSQTHGVYALPFEDIKESPFRFFMSPNTKNASDEIPFVTPSMEYIIASSRGYRPKEGDMIPADRLSIPTESRGDISSIGSFFEEDAPGSSTGTMHVYLQRQLNTFRRRVDDVRLVDGGFYDVAFAVSTGSSSGRDHYVSFPMTLSLQGAPADIEAVKLFGGSGLFKKPEFENKAIYPETVFNVVLPGIASYEFLTGKNEGKTYYKKADLKPVKQIHEGSRSMMADGLGCADCHTVAENETFKGAVFNVGSLEKLVTKRSGVFTPTPLPVK